MPRLIVISFVALGWAFFVMSGGTEFEPRGVRGETPERIAKVEPPVNTQIVSAQDFQPRVSSNTAEALVTNVAARTAPVRPKPEPAAQTEEDVVIVIDEPVEPALTQLSGFANPGANFTLASLEDGAVGLQQISVQVQNDFTPQEFASEPVRIEPQQDIREISGTRVNMRDGPGTIYPIIGKATIGQKVEVLSDSGTGWLRLRVMQGQQIGWVSSSLVR